jgi:hypothetical protein
VEDFGGAAVLEALEVAARRLRSEGIRPGHSASARGVSDLIHIVSSPPPFFASLSKNLKRACFRAGAVVIPATGGGDYRLDGSSRPTGRVFLFSLPDFQSLGSAP